MTIDLDALAMLGSARGGKRPALPINLTVMRELDASDLPALIERRAVAAVTPHVTQLRETHHFLARLLAEGRRQVEVSRIAGYSQSRISLLMKDPSFQELISYYKSQTDQSYVNVHERLARVGTVAIEVLEERLVENPDSFSHKELLAVAETTLDRSVAPPKTRDQPASSGPGGPVQVQISFVNHTPPIEHRPEGADGVLIDLNPTDSASE